MSATKSELIIFTAKEIMIAAIEKDPGLISYDSTGEVVENKAQNIVNNFQTIIDGVKMAYDGVKN